MDLVVGSVALVLDRRVGAIADIRSGPARLAMKKAPGPVAGTKAAVPGTAWTSRQWAIALLFGISGAVAIIYEVGWFRLLGLTMGPSVYAFSAMLGMYLAGVGAGSALGAHWVSRTRTSGLVAMAVLEGVLGAVGLLSLFYVNDLPMVHFRWARWTLKAFGEGGMALGQLGIAALVVFLPCLVMGVLFPVVVRALREAGRGAFPEPTVGRLYVSNTAGGILGSLAAGFWLLPAIGVWNTLVLAGLASAGIAVTAAFLARVRRPALRLALAAGGAAAAGVLAWQAPAWNVFLFNQGLYRDSFTSDALPVARMQAEKLVFYREGVNAPVGVMRNYGSATLTISGKPDASTNPGDLHTQLLAGHLPLLFCPAPKRVAVLGYGSGMTPGAILTHREVESLDIMEIEQAVIDASPYFESINQNPFDDPRTTLILEDGRIHLTYAPETYDVITSEPSNPWMAGISNLFTTDFYRTVRSRLAPHGIFAQWIQNYQITQDLFQGVLASIHESFPHLVIFRPNRGDCLVLASADPIAIPWETFRARFGETGVRGSFLRVDIRDPLEVPYFFQCPEEPALAFLAGAPQRNTDDNVWLEYRMPRILVRAAELARSKENVGLEVSRRGAPYRMRAIEALLPGIPLADCLRAMTLYPHGIEPTMLGSLLVADPWHETRVLLADAARKELKATGRAALAAEVLAWDREGETLRGGRSRTTEELIAAARTPEGPSAELVTRAFQTAPDLPIAVLMMGNALEASGDAEGAAALYRELLERPFSGTSYDGMLSLARLARARNDLGEALRLSTEAIARNPYLPNAYLASAEVSLLRGDVNGARGTIERGLHLNPGDPDLTRFLARIPEAS
jgi:spermidine synthase